MSVSVSTRFAVRSLLRNPRRTILSVAGIGVGVGVSLITIAFMHGEQGLIVKAAVEGGVGHLKIVPGEWPARRENELRLKDWRAELSAARSMEGVETVTPRARTDALLAFGTRVTGVELVGVDPETEQRAFRLVCPDRVAEGRYLRPGEEGAAVVGRAIAEHLDIGLEDEVMVSAVGRKGSIESGLLAVVGIVETGSRELDASICHASLADLERLTGIAGAGEISIILKDNDDLDEARAGLQASVPGGDVVLRWMDVVPELRAGLRVDEAWYITGVALTIFVVTLGIVSAQLTAVLERRREFALLSALGMKGARFVHLLVLEALVLGLAGAAFGLVVALPGVSYLATSGFDMRMFMEEPDLTMSNLLMDPVLYADIGPWLVSSALGMAIASTLLASVYPIWFANRTDPASGLRVVQ